jgi:thioredoxin-like negative regulator of GroEL
MDRTTYKDKVAIQNLGQFVSVKQDTDKEGSKTGQKYKVEFLPTLMVLDGNGKVVLKHVGALDTKELGQFLKDAAKKGATKKPAKAKK